MRSECEQCQYCRAGDSSGHPVALLGDTCSPGIRNFNTLPPAFAHFAKISA